MRNAHVEAAIRAQKIAQAMQIAHKNHAPIKGNNGRVLYKTPMQKPVATVTHRPPVIPKPFVAPIHKPPAVTKPFVKPTIPSMQTNTVEIKLKSDAAIKEITDPMLKEGIGAIDKILDAILGNKVFEKAEKDIKKAPAWAPYSPAQAWFTANPIGLQPAHMTKPNRFPLIMSRLKTLHPTAKKILSFGCSEGLECQDLLSTFPEAELIVGNDIDTTSIATARRNNKSDRILFTDEIRLLGQFDIITALMTFFVLECPLPKDRWTKALVELEKHVSINGIICIYTSDYDPAEVLIEDRYEPVNIWTRKHNKVPNGKDYYNGYYKKK
jgi:hypothetical protein